MIRLLLASSNSGKLREYQALATTAPSGLATSIESLPHFRELARFDEAAPTFAENAAGKARYYGQLTEQRAIADDSGLVVPALGGAPGVHSARYAGPNATDAEGIAKLLAELRAHDTADRGARFVCVIALAERGQVRGVFSDSVQGEILEAPRGDSGFGYDPIFYFPLLKKTFAELTGEQKNLYSHRGKAFRKLLQFLTASSVL